MTDLYDAAIDGDLERVMLLVEKGVNKNQAGGDWEETALSAAAGRGHLDILRYLVEQGADMEKTDRFGYSPLMDASSGGHLEVARYLLEQGANRDKANNGGYTSLHWAARNGHLETAKLLMVYGADLNTRNNRNQLPIDLARTEEIKQAIRDEPRRHMDHGHKRATEQDRQPNAATSAFAQQDDDEAQSNKKPRLNEEAVVAEEGKVAEEDEDSEPSSSDEEDD